MNTERAKAALAGRRFARVEWVESTGSTNVDLLMRARAGEPEQVLVADEQTEGRGRLGRVWQATAGTSLLCSILIREDVAPPDAARTTMALAIAGADACRDVAGVEVGIKWPNDLVVVGVGADGSDRKVSGMMSESVVSGGRLLAVVAGVGMNVNWPALLPAELVDIATSLNHLAGREIDRVDLLVSMLGHLEERLATTPAALVEDYKTRSATIWRHVRIEQPDGSWTGRAVDVTSSGALVVESDVEIESDGEVGELREVVAGDVIHLRPTH